LIIWNSSSTPRLNGALFPKFCSKGEPATIATVQADYMEAEGARLLVRGFGAAGGRRVLYWHG
jgi:hypothetical protein